MLSCQHGEREAAFDTVPTDFCCIPATIDTEQVASVAFLHSLHNISTILYQNKLFLL